MTKLDIVSKIVTSTGLTKEQTELAINSLFAEIIDAAKSSERVTFIRFGTFKSVTSAARIRRDRETGEEEIIGPKTSVKFIPAKSLKNLQLHADAEENTAKPNQLLC